MRLFLERNFDEVTVAAIAEAADVSVNTVFNYFPTKEDLFFTSPPPAESGPSDFSHTRKPHEPVIVFLQRYLDARVAEFPITPMKLTEIGYLTAVRRVLQQSPALQVHAAQAAERTTHDLEESFALDLAKDVKAEADDLSPRLIAAQVIAIYRTLFLEVERRRRAGEKSDRIQAILSSAARTALNFLENGIGNYGAKPS